jgi:hypothetical protein
VELQPGVRVGKELGETAQLTVWFGIEFVDPVAYDSWCAANGGSPLLSATADAAAI